MALKLKNRLALLTLSFFLPLKAYALVLNTYWGELGAYGYVSLQQEGRSAGRGYTYNNLSASSQRVGLKPYVTEDSVVNANRASWASNFNDLFGVHQSATNQVKGGVRNTLPSISNVFLQRSSINNYANALTGQFWSQVNLTPDMLIDYSDVICCTNSIISEMKSARAISEIIVPYRLNIDESLNGTDVYLPLRYRLQVTDTMSGSPYGDNRAFSFNLDYRLHDPNDDSIIPGVGDVSAVEKRTSWGNLDPFSDEDYVEWIKIRDADSTYSEVDLYVHAEVDISFRSGPAQTRAIKGQIFVNPDELLGLGLATSNATGYGIASSASDDFFALVPVPPSLILFASALIGLIRVKRQSNSSAS